MFLLNGSPHKIPLDGTNQGFGTPLFPTHLAWPQRHQPRSGTGTGEPQQRLRVDASFHQIWGPFWKGTGVFWRAGGRLGIDQIPRRLTALGRSCRGFRRTGNLAGLKSAVVAKSLIMSRMKDRFCGTSRRCGGGFAKQVAGNVENGKAPTLLGERFKIHLDEKFDGLFAGINPDPNRRVAEIDLVSSSVLSSNDGVWHYRLALRDHGKLRDDQARHFELAASRTTGARMGLSKNAADDRG
jgi:hypothetical protein